MNISFFWKQGLLIVAAVLFMAGCSQDPEQVVGEETDTEAEAADESKVGIIGPMEVEIDILRSNMDIEKEHDIAGLTFYEGTLKDQNIVLVQSGIGKVNASVAAQALISEFNVDTLINSGVAGSIHPDVGLGDIVISTQTVHHDMDETAKGYEPGQIPDMDVLYFKADEELISLAEEGTTGLPDYVDVFTENVATGDQFIHSEEKSQWIRDTFDAYVVEMEGAAVGQIAYLNDIPYVVIRSASDDAGEEAADIQENFVEEAAQNSSHVIENILENLN
ncbi:adenosylhomocysteine nucleosidase [Alteribacillus persepolensis]|uniref:adenosylhomocysteine nucleosidase n=1 Tax=Alteribacillus persepolensis TaxID=568899 RepID=A0A1G8FT69_9BACI|nr:5'-methylthioadenosine/adenosylhomocysteine nucleosidase [Alteribacillus persepolensis]SDH85310.1 adenosylhomocysteine nucleosidase [Alteribacillus persepolensis]